MTFTFVKLSATGFVQWIEFIGGADGILVRVSTTGQAIWAMYLGSSPGDSVAGIIETKDRGIAMVGQFGADQSQLKGLARKGGYQGAAEEFLLKLNGNGGT